MINIILTGVGGQGTVLAAKVLAVAAATRGWQVRTAETIGMAQRGGSVVSHVRMGNLGEPVHGPLVTHGCANLIIAFEPGEGARVLPYLSKTGTLITATSTVEPVSASLSDEAYNSKQILEDINLSLYNVMVRTITRGNSRMQRQARMIPIDDAAIVRNCEGGRKILNSVMLAAASAYGALPISIQELASAIEACVKPQFVDMNLSAISTALEMFRPLDSGSRLERQASQPGEAAWIAGHMDGYADYAGEMGNAVEGDMPGTYGSGYAQAFGGQAQRLQMGSDRFSSGSSQRNGEVRGQRAQARAARLQAEMIAAEQFAERIQANRAEIDEHISAAEAVSGFDAFADDDNESNPLGENGLETGFSPPQQNVATSAEYAAFSDEDIAPKQVGTFEKKSLFATESFGDAADSASRHPTIQPLKGSFDNADEA